MKNLVEMENSNIVTLEKYFGRLSEPVSPTQMVTSFKRKEKNTVKSSHCVVVMIIHINIQVYWGLGCF